MIVISGALVLVALVLLVIGLVSTSLGFVYASIAVSIVSFAFLIIGIVQRRGEQLPGTAAPADAPAPTSSDIEGVTAIIPADRGAGTKTAETAAAPAQRGVADGSVLVVAGRPRYHVAGCRYLAGKEASAMAAGVARADGYTACGVCKPDAALAETTADLQPAGVSAGPAKTGTAGAVPTTATTTAGQPARKAAAPASKLAAAAAPATSPVPSKGTRSASSSGSAGPAANRRGTVVVIPDRGKFHRQQCRFVRDASGAEELTRAQATRQGYDACGVCKP